MKRSHSDSTSILSPLPEPSSDDPKLFKATLEGSHRLKVIRVTDISKPVDKPIEDIDEPEEEDKARENKLNQGNARMIKLQLGDLNGKSINAIETEFIGLLTDVRTNSIVNIAGPASIRCGNIMLEKRHVVSVEISVKEEAPTVKETKQDVINIEDWDEEEEDDCIILE